MAQRVFNVTVPSGGAYHNLYSLIVGTAAYGAVNGGTNETGITGAIPPDSILPDRGNVLTLLDPTTGGGSITVGDRNNANSPGVGLAANQSYNLTSSVNSICFKDYLVSGSGSLQVTLGWI